jgi:propanol-preferring alcohol dehydrogenase
VARAGTASAAGRPSASSSHRSIVGTRNDLADVVPLHAAGRTTVIAVERKLDEVNEAMADVLFGQVPARVVFRF